MAIVKPEIHPVIMPICTVKPCNQGPRALGVPCEGVWHMTCVWYRVSFTLTVGRWFSVVLSIRSAFEV